MSNGITLTSAMRNNLGALKYLSGQMDITQTRLATGQKVNSAIDNASSFYQARALTNRASDLDRLLDSMGQSIQTINAAISGLEHAGATLEQAAVVAQQAYEAAIIPEKAWFEAQVGENGAVVSTAQELKDAIDSGKETICVYGKIDYFEDQTLTMKAGQKLVGTEYFTGYSGNKKFSEINFKGTQQNAIKTAKNALISDLNFNYQSYTTSSSNLIAVYGVNNNLNNIDIDHKILGKPNLAIQGSITTFNGASAIINGTVNISKDKKNTVGMWSGSDLTIAKGAKLNLTTLSPDYGAIYINANLNVYGEINVLSNSINYSSLTLSNGGNLNIYETGKINTKAPDVAVMAIRNPNKTESLYMAKGATINALDKDGSITIMGRGLTREFGYTNYETLVSSARLQLFEEFDSVPCNIDWDNFANTAVGSASDEVALNKIAGQYGEMMNAYDDMIKDSSYQGINLLTGGKLTTMFNETRSNSFKVEGADMTAESLGIATREWQTKEDIAQSIKEIKDAMYKVRDMVEVLGNNLSIIETRMNFTDALTDILQIGADELVLADMNEESANYLALQTRQQLAVNALSLAAQSSSAVLKLF